MRSTASPSSVVSQSTPQPSLPRTWLVIALIATLTLAVLLFQLLFHGHFRAIDEYDDGVYFGSSIELMHGVLPYRDFAFIQPPMISVLLLPFALLSLWTGTAVAMEVARLGVDIVAVANVVLVGAIVRRRSIVQVILATGTMAFYEGTIRSAQTILLEPFLVLFCLIAVLVLLDGDAVSRSGRRVLWCGVFFGVAGATKIWAVLPLLAALVIVWPLGVQLVKRLLGGALLGFFVCSIPFIVAAPLKFVQQVIFIQSIRNESGYPPLQRLASLTGIAGFSSFVAAHKVLGEVSLGSLAAIALILIAICLWDPEHKPWSPLERFMTLSTGLIAAALMVSPTYYYHYSGFLAPFAAMCLTIWIVRLIDASRRWFAIGHRVSPQPAVWLGGVLPVVLLFVALANLVATQPPAPQLSDPLNDAIPANGCVLYANPTVGLLDNRFTADVSGCPSVIDWLGQERVLDNGVSTSISDRNDRALQDTMIRWITTSDAVVLGVSNLALDNANERYLSGHFSKQSGVPPGVRVFVRNSGSQRKAEHPRSVHRSGGVATG